MCKTMFWSHGHTKSHMSLHLGSLGGVWVCQVMGTFWLQGLVETSPELTVMAATKGTFLNVS